MSSELKINVFINEFNSLLSFLINSYPVDPSLKMLQTAAAGMIYMDKVGFVNSVIDTLNPYKTQILNRNEAFFLEEISEHSEEFSTVSSEISKVKEIWRDPKTTDSMKSSIWKYFIFMVRLGEKI
jgi:hypothetical protein